MRKGLIERLEKAKLSRFHYILLLIGSLIYAFTAMNVMLIGAVIPAIVKDWNLDPLIAGYLLSAGYLGMFVGAISCGYLADVLGRRKTLLLVISLMTVFTTLTGVSWDVISMAAFRFLAGIGLGGALPQPGIYVSEFVPAKYRGRFIGIIEASWVYGVLLSLLFPYFLLPLYGWRLTFLVAMIPIFLAPLVLAFLPESIRFLQLRGRREEAKAILEAKGLLPDGGEAISARESFSMLWSAKYWRRTFLLWILWAVLVYTYHGIFIWLPTLYVKEFGFEVVKSLFWVLVVTLVQIPGYYSATFLLDRAGRKPVLIAYLGLAGIGAVLLSMATDITSILIWSCMISFFNLGAWAGLYTYTPELYPTEIRGTGSGTAASIGRVAGILAPTLTIFLYTTGGLLSAFSAFALAHFLAVVAVFVLGIETKGKVLEKI